MVGRGQWLNPVTSILMRDRRGDRLMKRGRQCDPRTGGESNTATYQGTTGAKKLVSKDLILPSWDFWRGLSSAHTECLTSGTVGE